MDLFMAKALLNKCFQSCVFTIIPENSKLAYRRRFIGERSSYA